MIASNRFWCSDAEGADANSPTCAICDPSELALAGRNGPLILCCGETSSLTLRQSWRRRMRALDDAAQCRQASGRTGEAGVAALRARSNMAAVTSVACVGHACGGGHSVVDGKGILLLRNIDALSTDLKAPIAGRCALRCVRSQPSPSI